MKRPPSNTTTGGSTNDKISQDVVEINLGFYQSGMRKVSKHALEISLDQKKMFKSSDDISDEGSEEISRLDINPFSHHYMNEDEEDRKCFFTKSYKRPKGESKLLQAAGKLSPENYTLGSTQYKEEL